MPVTCASQDSSSSSRRCLQPQGPAALTHRVPAGKAAARVRLSARLAMRPSCPLTVRSGLGQRCCAHPSHTLLAQLWRIGATSSLWRCPLSWMHGQQRRQQAQAAAAAVVGVRQPEVQQGAAALGPRGRQQLAVMPPISTCTCQCLMLRPWASLSCWARQRCVHVQAQACASASKCRGKHVRMCLTLTCRQDASRLLCGAGALAQSWSFVYQLCRAPNSHAHDCCTRGDCMACRASVNAGGVVSLAAAAKRPSQDARPAPAESQQQQGSCAAACAVAQVHKAAGSAGCGRRTTKDAAGSARCGHTVLADAAATAATGAKSAAGTAVCVCFCGVQQGCVLAGQGARREVDTCFGKIPEALSCQH